MTQRSFYDDAYRRRFSASVLGKTWHDKHPAIILDHTFFYPDSGGQPHDVGTLSGIRVLDVQIRDSDGAILHFLEEPIDEVVVEAEIDWTRRFDHMQQHTGQHLLSQAFMQLTKAETISFHMGKLTSTIDLNIKSVPPNISSEVESFANGIIWENRSVSVRYLSKENIESLHLRKTPNRPDEQLRIVEIEDFDRSACGGTHVSATGEIGLVKITGFEKRADNMRVEFVCGGRALMDYDLKSGVISQLIAELTTAESELPNAVVRLKEEVKSANRQTRQHGKVLAQIEAARLLETAEEINGAKVVTAVYDDRDPADVRTIAKGLTKNQATIALLGIAGKKSQLIFSSSQDIQSDMADILRTVLPLLGTESGGGTTLFAQGGGPPATVKQIKMTLEKAKQLVDADFV